MFHRSNCSHINIGSGNGLVPSGTKPLPKPMLTQDLWCLMMSLGPNELKDLCYIFATQIHRSITPKFVTLTAPSYIDNSWRSTTLPAADSGTRLAPTRHFRFRMSTNEYWKNSDNWIIRCHKFSGDVLISSKVSFFMWLRKILILCK